MSWEIRREVTSYIIRIGNKLSAPEIPQEKYISSFGRIGKIVKGHLKERTPTKYFQCQENVEHCEFPLAYKNLYEICIYIGC